MDESRQREYSTAELIELAATAGYDRPTAVQLAQWHRYGLLPRPRKQPLGKGNGSVSLYPSETGPWLLELLEIHKREGGHRLLHVAWRLWWAGRPVLMSRVREQMGRVADTVDKQRAEVVALSVEEREAKAEHLHHKELAPGSKTIGRARQRVRKDSPLLFRIVFEAMSGPFDPSTDEMLVLQKASGLARMGASKPSSEPVPPLDAVGRATLSAWAESLRQPMRPLLDSLSDEDLIAARDDVRTLFANLQGYIKVSQALRTKGEVVVTDWSPAQDVLTQAAFVLIWRSVLANARATEGETIDPAAASATAREFTEFYESVRALRRSDTFADLLSPDRLSDAMNNPARRERFVGDLQVRIAENTQEAAALLQQAQLDKH